MTEMTGLHRTIILTPGNNSKQKYIIESIKLKKKILLQKDSKLNFIKSFMLKNNHFK